MCAKAKHLPFTLSCFYIETTLQRSSRHGAKFEESVLRQPREAGQKENCAPRSFVEVLNNSPPRDDTGSTSRRRLAVQKQHLNHDASSRFQAGNVCLLPMHMICGMLERVPTLVAKIRVRNSRRDLVICKFASWHLEVMRETFADGRLFAFQHANHFCDLEAQASIRKKTWSHSDSLRGAVAGKAAC